MKKSRLKQKFAKIANNLTEELLGRYYATPLTFAQTRRQMYGFIVGPKRISSKRLYDKVERVRKQGWLEKKVVEDKFFYNLTASGRIKYLTLKLKTAKKEMATQATIVIFDIPEEKRKFRNFLRNLLKQMKFTTIQKSVLIAPYVLPQEFYDLLEEMNLLKFIKVIEGKIRF